jgi:3-oxoacyl-[acyl-carrier protein] reductase
MIRIGDSIEFTVSVAKVSTSRRMLDLDIVGRHVASRAVYLVGKARVMALRDETEKPQPSTPKEGHLSRKTVIVTGASGELGSCICKRLALEGAAIIGIGRNRDRLDALAQSIGEAWQASWAVDLLDLDQLSDYLRGLSDASNLFGIVHAASPPMRGADAADPSNMEALRNHWTVAVGAFARIAEKSIPLMRDGGSIVSILTQSVYDVPPPKLSAYVSAKMALWGLVRALAAEYASKGIRSNAISPSLINTPFTNEVPVRFKQVEEARNPLRRLCTPSDVAEAVAFLCGPQASFINGVNLPVTGGANMA